MLPRVRVLAESESSSSDDVHPSQFEREDAPEPHVRAPTPGPRGRPTSAGSRRPKIRLRSRVGISNHEARLLRDGTIIRGRRGVTFAGFVPNPRRSPRVSPPPPPPPPPPYESIPPPPYESPPSLLSSSRPPWRRQKVVRFASPLEQHEEPSATGIESMRINYDADEGENEDNSSASWSDSSIELSQAPEHNTEPESTSTTARDAPDTGGQNPDSSACKRRHPKTSDSNSAVAGSPTKKSKLNTE